VRSYRFYKDESSRWYVDLYEWEGEEWELEMVMGADTFLNILSQGEDEVNITLSTEPFDGCETLHFIHEGRIEGPEIGEGAWYRLDKYMGLDFNLQMWLCDVTKFVFGNFPKKIYFK